MYNDKDGKIDEKKMEKRGATELGYGVPSYWPCLVVVVFPAEEFI